MPNWFSRLFARSTTAERPTVHRHYYTGRTLAGVYVDAESALKNATVWACIQYLTRTVAQLPWRVGRELSNGGFEVAGTHPADYLLHKRPNPEMGSFNFRQTLLGWALRYGNGYAEIERDARGAVYALWPIHPDRVSVKRDDQGQLVYEVWNERGGPSYLASADVYHIRGFGDGVCGLNVIEYAAQSVGWAQATEVFGSTFFGEGMNPTGIISTEKAMSIEASKRLKEEFKQLYAGPKGDRTAILDGGLKFEKVAYTPEDGQFIETRQHQVEEICRWFGVPPHKVMHLLRATFSNIEHQSIEVVVDSITPWVKIFEEEADFKLFPARSNLISKMNLKGLLRGDATARAAFYKAMFETGALTPDDILRAEDMNPIGGEEGNARFVSNNVQPLKLAINPPASRPATATEDPLIPPAKPNGSGRPLPN